MQDKIRRMPQHLAVIMDGNGRWAKARGTSRRNGHLKGVQAARNLVTICHELKIPFLTLFAFSTENWSRPESEVSFLQNLLVLMLRREIRELHRSQVRVKIVGNTAVFNSRSREVFALAERLTAANPGLTLNICINYGGYWDITQAVNAAMQQKPGQPLEEADIESCLALSFAPHPDLLIRTSGEYRLSNFLMWQLAYTELYFADCYWPDFDALELERALAWFQGRERRFGLTSEQLAPSS